MRDDPDLYEHASVLASERREASVVTLILGMSAAAAVVVLTGKVLLSMIGG